MLKADLRPSGSLAIKATETLESQIRGNDLSGNFIDS